MSGLCFRKDTPNDSIWLYLCRNQNCSQKPQSLTPNSGKENLPFNRKNPCAVQDSHGGTLQLMTGGIKEEEKRRKDRGEGQKEQLYSNYTDGVRLKQSRPGIKIKGSCSPPLNSADGLYYTGKCCNHHLFAQFKCVLEEPDKLFVRRFSNLVHSKGEDQYDTKKRS